MWAAQPCVLSAALNMFIIIGGTWDFGDPEARIARGQDSVLKTCVLLLKGGGEFTGKHV